MFQEIAMSAKVSQPPTCQPPSGALGINIVRTSPSSFVSRHLSLLCFLLPASVPGPTSSYSNSHSPPSNPTDTPSLSFRVTTSSKVRALKAQSGAAAEEQEDEERGGPGAGDDGACLRGAVVSCLSCGMGRGRQAVGKQADRGGEGDERCEDSEGEFSSARMLLTERQEEGLTGREAGEGEGGAPAGRRGTERREEEEIEGSGDSTGEYEESVTVLTEEGTDDATEGEGEEDSYAREEYPDSLTVASTVDYTEGDENEGGEEDEGDSYWEASEADVEEGVQQVDGRHESAPSQEEHDAGPAVPSSASGSGARVESHGSVVILSQGDIRGVSRGLEQSLSHRSRGELMEKENDDTQRLSSALSMERRPALVALPNQTVGDNVGVVTEADGKDVKRSRSKEKETEGRRRREKSGDARGRDARGGEDARSKEASRTGVKLSAAASSILTVVRG